MWLDGPTGRQGAGHLVSKRPAVLSVALAWDVVLGEPPAAMHPVVGVGRGLVRLEGAAPRGSTPRFAYGLAVALSGTTVCYLVGSMAERTLPWPLQAALLKPAFAGQQLHGAAQRVEEALAAGNLPAARDALRWLVSRDASTLDESLVAAGAIESLAENLVDSWVAPLLAYALFGLGGAWAYRFANTADAMWGYRNERYEWLGKAVARLDDVLNWMPARVGAFCLAIASRQPAAAFAAWGADSHRTASPNAGQTMAAAAGALGVRLEKVEHYVLNADGRAPDAAAIASARALVARAMALAAALAWLIALVRHRG